MSATLLSPVSARMRLVMACRIDRVRPIAQSVRCFLAHEHVAAEDLGECELALVEACNNAILNVTEAGRSIPVEVEVACDECEIELSVFDHTAGFDLPDTIDLPPSECESGRGLFIMRAMMDDISYQRGENGNSLILRKRRRESRSGPAATFAPPPPAMQITESEEVIQAMAEELSSCYETLSAIFRSGANLGKAGGAEEFSHSLCEDLLRITAADCFVLRTISEDQRQLIALASHVPGNGLSLPAIELSGNQAASIERTAAVSRKAVWFDSANRPEAGDPLAEIGPSCTGVTHPFFSGGNLTGTLTVAKTKGVPPFTAAQGNVIHTLAEFLGIQITAAQLREEHMKSRLVSHELEIARNIQKTLLPRNLPTLSNLAVAAHCQSAEDVGGDFYDVFQMNERSLLLTVADVMGKGIPAAMFAAILRSLIRAASELARSPAMLLTRINQLIFADLSEVDMFITAQLAFIDTKNNELRLASAGHCPMLWMPNDESKARLLSPEGLPLGIAADAIFKEHVEKLSGNSRGLLYTDGVTDTRAPDGEFFGQPRLVRWFEQDGKHCDAEQLKSGLLAGLTGFRNNNPLFDDQTFCALTGTAMKEIHVTQDLTGG